MKKSFGHDFFADELLMPQTIAVWSNVSIASATYKQFQQHKLLCNPSHVKQNITSYIDSLCKNFSAFARDSQLALSLSVKLRHLTHSRVFFVCFTQICCQHWRRLSLLIASNLLKYTVSAILHLTAFITPSIGAIGVRYSYAVIRCFWVCNWLPGPLSGHNLK